MPSKTEHQNSKLNVDFEDGFGTVVKTSEWPEHHLSVRADVEKVKRLTWDQWSTEMQATRSRVSRETHRLALTIASQARALDMKTEVSESDWRDGVEVHIFHSFGLSRHWYDITGLKPQLPFPPFCLLANNKTLM